MFERKKEGENGREREEVIGGWRKLYIQGGPKVNQDLNRTYSLFVGLFLARQPRVGQGPLIHEVPRLHTKTHHSR